MKTSILAGVVFAILLAATISTGSAQAASNDKSEPGPTFEWATVVNNNDVMPHSPRNFNSYNQPSVNLNGLVVFRARSRGGRSQGPPTHGIYTRDMLTNGPIVRVLDRTTEVPYPKNLGTTFVETPSFPRIDMGSATIATRGNHQPVWKYDLPDGSETRAGTTGIYTNPFSELITGANKLGNVSGFSFFQVPDPEFTGTLFEVFPGSPSVTNGNTIVFKGNYTGDRGGETGVYYRQLDDQSTGGESPVVMIANNTDTLIPGTSTPFGSTSPPSAANGLVVFAGFDNEEAPTLGGIYLAPLQSEPQLTPLVSIGKQVPGEPEDEAFNNLGEGGAFDGRYVAFWAAWGEKTKKVRLYCAEEGNKDRIAYCNQNLVCADTGETLGDQSSICDDVTDDPSYGSRCYQEKEVPVDQGLFIHDIKTGITSAVAKNDVQFDEFLFWNYSGKTPCTGGGHSEEGAEDDGEPARWRSSAFVAVSAESGKRIKVKTAFKARTGKLVDGIYVNPVDGIYLGTWSSPGSAVEIETILDTTMSGQVLDPVAPEESMITALGIERESLRGSWLTVNASMGIEGGSEEDGMAGIYLTELP